MLYIRVEHHDEAEPKKQFSWQNVTPTCTRRANQQPSVPFRSQTDSRPVAHGHTLFEVTCRYGSLPRPRCPPHDHQQYFTGIPRRDHLCSSPFPLSTVYFTCALTALIVPNSDCFTSTDTTYGRPKRKFHVFWCTFHFLRELF